MSRFRHPVPWILAVTAAVTAVQYLAFIGFRKIGWTGPAKVIHPTAE